MEGKKGEPTGSGCTGSQETKRPAPPLSPWLPGDSAQRQKSPGARSFSPSHVLPPFSSLGVGSSHGFLSFCTKFVWERRPFPPYALRGLKSNSVSCLLKLLVLESSKFLSSLFSRFFYLLLWFLMLFCAT